MKARDVKTNEDAILIINERNLTHVKVGIFDIDGVMRGSIWVKKIHFFSKSGFAFCDVVLGWDSKDQPYDNVSFTGWHTGYPDAPVRIIPESCRDIPFEDNMLLFMGEFTQKGAEICPRSLLKESLNEVKKWGLMLLLP